MRATPPRPRARSRGAASRACSSRRTPSPSAARRPILAGSPACCFCCLPPAWKRCSRSSTGWPRRTCPAERMDLDEARRRFADAPVARLGSVTPDGRPHLVPVTFALLEGRAADPAEPTNPDTIAFAVDAKPKTTRALQRLTNLRAHPAASLLVDHYDSD